MDPPPAPAPAAQEASPPLRRRARGPAVSSLASGASSSSAGASSAAPASGSSTQASTHHASTQAPTPAPPAPTFHPARRARAPDGARLVVPLAAALFVGGLSAGLFAAASSVRVILVAGIVCVATFVSVLLRLLVHGPVPGRVRGVRGIHRLTGERAAYVRTSQRLSMMDRDFTDADYELLLDLDNNSTRLRRFLDGASQDFIDRLPTYTYKKPTEEEEKKEGGPSNPELGGDTVRRCAICLDDFPDGAKIRILPCFHRFMADCIDPWLLEHGRCPVCKAKIHQ